MDYLLETNFQPSGFVFYPASVWALPIAGRAKLTLLVLWSEYSEGAASISLAELCERTSLSSGQVETAIAVLRSVTCDIPCAVCSDRGGVLLPVRRIGSGQ